MPRRNINLRASVPSEVLLSMLLDQVRADIQIAETLDRLAVHAHETLRCLSLSPSSGLAGVRSVQVSIDTEIIDVFTDDLVWTDGVPPESTVGERRDGFDHWSGNRWEVGHFAHGEELDQVEHLIVGVSFGTGEDKGGGGRGDGGGKHDVECFSDVEDVDRHDAGLTTVELVLDRVFCNVSTIRSVRARTLTDHVVEQPILSSEHEARSDNGSFRESVPDRSFSFPLGSVHL